MTRMRERLCLGQNSKTRARWQADEIVLALDVINRGTGTFGERLENGLADKNFRMVLPNRSVKAVQAKLVSLYSLRQVKHLCNPARFVYVPTACKGARPDMAHTSQFWSNTSGRLRRLWEAVEAVGDVQDLSAIAQEMSEHPVEVHEITSEQVLQGLHSLRYKNFSKMMARMGASAEAPL